MESSAGGGLCESLGGAQGVGGCYKEMKPGGVERAGPDCRGRVIGLPPGLMLCSGRPPRCFRVAMAAGAGVMAVEQGR